MFILLSKPLDSKLVLGCLPARGWGFKAFQVAVGSRDLICSVSSLGCCGMRG